MGPYIVKLNLVCGPGELVLLNMKGLAISRVIPGGAEEWSGRSYGVEY